ncbi:GTP-binding protein [hydrothermal vent metagenome]|uniref:GTP-binding protein n=1 Tax=hydrothermal vent metagenome TaxID=652676 RepID=A0A3B0TZI6_9ZZZZ
MRKPVARPTQIQATETQKQKPAPETPERQPPGSTVSRPPRAFAPGKVEPDPVPLENWDEDKNLPEIADTAPMAQKGKNWPLRMVLATGGLLVSLGLSLMLDRLIRDLFARYDWLGWLGVGALFLLLIGIVVLAWREISALKRLGNLDRLRHRAAKVLETNLPADGATIAGQLNQLYANRPDLAHARQLLDQETIDQFDGANIIHSAERHLMSPLDKRARALIAAAARRVAVVTAISPRAIVDVAFVFYESVKLARAIAALYGARPGLIGGWRLAKEVLSHLAITGGVALGDSVIQQLLGHGLAARLSARLGEGLVNGLMTVRVGIAAMGVTRPLPFDRIKQPQVIDFAADLAKIGQNKPEK